eukprot:TRINITY_DN49646_c0_g1_i1.p1 TRINITY_DN49646_c0_g1~~TRINITY_DN49646_c0_g1_i1.p1  ORF type:complete len:333 (+),score=77.24 TRINITY_DN49646_c0_g1_i1:56-1054(+)
MAEEGFVPLTAQLLRSGLSEIVPVVGGGGFAFSTLNCSSKDINHLGNKLEECYHLRHIILSNNQITDITAVSRLNHLLSLKVDANAVASLDCLTDEGTEEEMGTDLPWCQRLDLASNKIVTLPSLKLLPRLRFLRLESNEIASLEHFGGHPAIEELELQGNKLTGLIGLGRFDTLRVLKLAGNSIETLEGLDAPVLDTLDMNGNVLTHFQHIEGAAALTVFDVSNNQLPAPETADSLPAEFQHLGCALPQLRTLSVSGCPVSSLKLELIICVPQVTMIDGAEITDEERAESTGRLKEIEEAEKVRAREKAEAEAAAAAEAAEAEAEQEEEEG